MIARVRNQESLGGRLSLCTSTQQRYIHDGVKTDPSAAEFALPVLVCLQQNLCGGLIRSDLCWGTRWRENMFRVDGDILRFHPRKLDQNAQRSEHRVGRANECKDWLRGGGTPLRDNAIDVLRV